MFAFAVWDRREQELVLGRDRMGEKPLYYSWLQNKLVFASELKALRVHPGLQFDVCRAALGEYLQRGYVPAPATIFERVWKLPPGTYLRINSREFDRDVVPETYWSLSNVAEAGISNPLTGDAGEIESELEALLRDSILRRTIADVGVGVFLSGGVDSSLVSALMRTESAGNVRSFSIGFREARYDEAPFAKEVSDHLGTEHTELYVDAETARAVVPQLPAIYDEPFGDSSAIPTVLLSRLTRKHVTVALSGDGGDELFGGYARYQSAGRMWRRTRKLPSVLRRSLARALQHEDGTARTLLMAGIGPGRAMARSDFEVRRQLNRVVAVLKANSATAFYDAFTTQWWNQEIGEANGSRSLGTFSATRAPSTDFMSAAMLRDGCVYLPDDILVKVDRASMAASLEVRVPLLDHRVVEMAWRIPPHLRCHLGKGKWLLRRILRRYLPEALIERPKQGFAVPVDDWLRGPLRQWASDLLDPGAMERDGYLNAETIQRAWKEHLAGVGHWRDPLWIVLMFQAWRYQNC
jgi:asparagine synthase (glutamine-hydrolysing)